MECMKSILLGIRKKDQEEQSPSRKKAQEEKDPEENNPIGNKPNRKKNKRK